MNFTSTSTKSLEPPFYKGYLRGGREFFSSTPLPPFQLKPLLFFLLFTLRQTPNHITTKHQFLVSKPQNSRENLWVRYLVTIGIVPANQAFIGGRTFFLSYEKSACKKWKRSGREKFSSTFRNASMQRPFQRFSGSGSELQ